MDKGKKHKTLYSEWTITEPIELDDICVLESTGQEYLCSKIIYYKQFSYLYFGSFDFKDILFAVQYRKDEKNYTKVLTDKSEQAYAFNVYKEQK
ncbi:MAG: hypothetical protein K6G49_03320 [Candidatus Saccharibacteria bacterium]|nr:hypothetical protein [Candidatus Saccharibacteria bacterium]